MVVSIRIDLDLRGFSDLNQLYAKICGSHPYVECLATRRDAVAHRFIQRREELRTHCARAYDFQRALCEDPDLVNAWFRLSLNIRNKCGILDCGLYSFDEIGFIMGIIRPSLVVTRFDRRGKGKAVQPGNWKDNHDCLG